MGAPHVTPEMWEQRRYEIAKEILPLLIAASIMNDVFVYGEICDYLCEQSVKAADKLIKQLKQLKQP